MGYPIESYNDSIFLTNHYEKDKNNNDMVYEVIVKDGGDEVDIGDDVYYECTKK